MSKRRRDRQPNLPPEAFNSPAAVQPETSSATPATTPVVKRVPAIAVPAIDWKDEYGEVLGDLRRTFIIFAVIVAAMVVLSFVIR